jgi:hypothetical protein
VEAERCGGAKWIVQITVNTLFRVIVSQIIPCYMFLCTIVEIALCVRTRFERTATKLNSVLSLLTDIETSEAQTTSLLLC